jgi:tetratricopeptide (TPR) repeat protein
VLLKLSKAWKSLGNTNELKQVNRVLNASEQGSAELSNAQVCAPGEFDDYTAKLNAQLAVGGLELQQTALASYTLLYKQFYENAARREWIEQTIIGSWNKLPYLNRIDLLTTLTETAQQAGDLETAQHLADVAQALVDDSVWPVEYHVQVLAKMADLRCLCEQPELASVELQEAVDLFMEQKAKIIDVFRTESLLPVAEAYARMGDVSNARNIYALAVEEAVVNNNSRPRAEDLCLIGLSMAQYEVEPDASLWDRMNEIKAGLGDPW